MRDTGAETEELNHDMIKKKVRDPVHSNEFIPENELEKHE
jgi:hypothetical protein